MQERRSNDVEIAVLKQRMEAHEGWMKDIESRSNARLGSIENKIDALFSVANQNAGGINVGRWLFKAAIGVAAFLAGKAHL